MTDDRDRRRWAVPVARSWWGLSTMRYPIFTSLVVAGSIAGAIPADAAVISTTFVPSINPTPTLLGAVVAGQSYTISTTGISDLYDAFNGGLGLTFTAEGIPTYAFPAPYSAFNPVGLSYDPTSNIQCAGGAALKCGALIGAIVPMIGATPTSYLLLGSASTFTAATSGFLVGLVNDVPAYGDNGPEGFTVTFSTVSAVPEPATWGLMLLGLGMVGGTMRRRSIKMAFATG